MLPRFIDSALLREREWKVRSLIVDRTHLVLVSGKLVLQKTSSKISLKEDHNGEVRGNFQSITCKMRSSALTALKKTEASTSWAPV